jgi:hypothetical protein
VLLFVWLSILGFSHGEILRSRLMCSEGGVNLWLGDEGIVTGKTSTPSSIFQQVMGPHPFSQPKTLEGNITARY